MIFREISKLKIGVLKIYLTRCSFLDKLKSVTKMNPNTFIFKGILNSVRAVLEIVFIIILRKYLLSGNLLNG